MNSLAPISQLYAFNDKVLDGVVGDLEGTEWFERPGDGGNPAYWILGHLALCRRHLARGLGAALPVADWEARFARGSQPGAGDDGLSPQALLEDFRNGGEAVRERLAQLSEDDLAAPFGHRFADGSESRGGAARFLYFHESYHLGQLGLLRRILGKPGLR